MKRIILLCSFMLGLCLPGMAQTDLTLTVGVAVPPEQEGFDGGAMRLLETRLKAVMAAGGLGTDMCGDFVVCPRLRIASCEMAEGGLKNFYTVCVDMTLFVTQLSTMTDFATCQKTLRGTGLSKEKAVREAISRIGATDNLYAAFLREAKEKIVAYYSTNLDDLLRRARSLGDAGQYEEALSLLMTFPTALPGSDRVMDEADRLYQQRIDREGERILTEARAALAAGDNGRALDLLRNVNVSAAGYKEVPALIREAGAAEAEAVRYEREMEERREKRETDLEAQRIGAIRDICVAYAQRKVKVACYNIVNR